MKERRREIGCEREDGVEESLVRVSAGDRIHLKRFTCTDCDGQAVYKAWAAFRK